MAKPKFRFRGLLLSIALAMVSVNALPHRERRSLEPGAIGIDRPYTSLWALLMRRDGSGGGSERASKTRQHTATAPFEGSRLAPVKVPVEGAQLSELDLAVLAINDGARSTGGTREPRLHHYRPYHHRRTSSVANEPPNISGNSNHIDARPYELYAYDPGEVMVTVEEVDTISGGVGAQLDKRHGHHPHRSDDTSKGRRSLHWYEHHHLDPNDPHYHHHHENHRIRMSSPRPRRLRSYNDDKIGGTFIAPASVRMKSKNWVKSGSRGPGVASGKMRKKPKEQVPTGLYRAVRPVGTGTNSSTATSGQASQKPEQQLDQEEPLIRRNFTMNATTYETIIPAAEMSGIIDLIAHVNRAKLGGLSVSLTPPSTFGGSPDNATPFPYLIDATLNPTEQATFYIRLVEKSPLVAEPPTKLPTQPAQDILVSLQARIPNPECGLLCATFNPLARDVQALGLAPCLHDSGIGGSAGLSQTFKYSPLTGIIRPFYGVECESGIPMGDEVNRMNDPKISYPSDTLHLNTTTVIALGSTPVSLASPSPLLLPVLLLNSTTANSTPSARDAPILTNPSMLDHTRPFMIRESVFASQSPAGSGGLEEAGEGVLMMFRRIHNAPSEDLGLTQGIRLDMKRSPVRDEGLAQVEPKLVDNNPLDAESAKDDNFDKFLRGVDGTSTSGLKPRRTGRLVGRAGWETTMARDNITTTGSRIADAGAEHAIAATPSPFQPSSSPTSYPPTSAPNPATSHYHSGESAGKSEPKPLPKPVMNVAYFGDSGRSPPVPPEDQADNERAILVADPSKSKKPGATPVTLATASDEGPRDEGTIPRRKKLQLNYVGSTCNRLA
ncbi:hypothetical protein FS749_011568 [Ceratobasidium sp. UAMH 11750]|nr:hypothetical protein FS749_011568 [Ceratobasidium sp. UAMH 11750]